MPRSAALPTLIIAEGALDSMFSAYKELLPGLGGYLTHAGQLHRGRLQVLLDRIGALELDTLEMRAKVPPAPPSIAHTPGAPAFGMPSTSDVTPVMLRTQHALNPCMIEVST